MNVFAVIKTALRERRSFSFYQASNRIDSNLGTHENLFIFAMNFVGVFTTFLFLVQIIYGQLDGVYIDSVIVQSPVLRILSRNHTRIPHVAIN